MTVRDQLLRMLADGQPHSGTALAGQLGITRSAVWKQVHRLADLGLEIHSTRVHGYSLSRPLELLRREDIVRAVAPEVMSACEHMEIRAVTGSTNADLLAQPAPVAGRWRALMAEYQTGGRGRRGRRWMSVFGSGLCLSLSWSYSTVPRELPALSLAAGIAVRRALVAAGARSIFLKWPNDLISNGGKLGGILVDVEGDSRGPLRAVIGIGLNVQVPEKMARDVSAAGGLPATGLQQAIHGREISRNQVAGAVITSLVWVLRDFGDRGFMPLADEWRQHDYLYGHPVSVSSNQAEPLDGVARGIAADGALLVERPEGLMAVFNGDVSLRVDS